MASEIIQEHSEVIDEPSETVCDLEADIRDFLQWWSEFEEMERRPPAFRPTYDHFQSRDSIYSEAAAARERARVWRMRCYTLLYLTLYLFCAVLLLGVLTLIAIWDIAGKFKPRIPSFEVVQLSGGPSLTVNVPYNILQMNMAIKMESEIHNSKLRVWYEGMTGYMTFNDVDNKVVVFKTNVLQLPALSQAHKEKLEWDLVINPTASIGSVPDAASLLLRTIQSGNITANVHVRGIEKWKSYRLQKTSGNRTIDVNCPVTINTVSDTRSVYGPCNVSYV